MEYPPYVNDGKTILWENNFLDYNVSDVKKKIVNYPLIVIVGISNDESGVKI